MKPKKKVNISKIIPIEPQPLDIYTTDISYLYDIPQVPLIKESSYSIVEQERDPKLKNYNPKTISFDTEKEMQDYITSNKLHRISTGKYEKTNMKQGGNIKRKKYALGGVTEENPIPGAVSLQGTSAIQPIQGNLSVQDNLIGLNSAGQMGQQGLYESQQGPVYNTNPTSEITPIATTKQKKSTSFGIKGKFNTANITAGVIAGANAILPELYQPEDNQNMMKPITNPYGSGDGSQAIYKQGGKVKYQEGGITPQERDAFERMQGEAYRQGFLGSDHSRQPGIDFMQQYGVDPNRLSAYQADFQQLAQTDPSRIRSSSEGLSKVDDFYGHKTAQQRYKKYQVLHNNKEVFSPSTNIEEADRITSNILNQGWDNKPLIPSTPEYEGLEQRYNQEVAPIYAQPTASVNKASFYEGEGENDYSIDKVRENYAKSGIHIKPENRGKFNALKKRTGKSTEELTHSKNPLTRKRAIFAQNAAKWKHEDGGTILDAAQFAQFSAWKNKLPKNLQYEDDYDLKGFWKENPNFNINDPAQHLTDKYKLPNHPTFSDESMYFNATNVDKAGHWEGNKYIPFKKMQHGGQLADHGMQIENNSYSMLSPYTGKLSGRFHTDGGTDIAFGGQTIEAEKNETFTKDKYGNLVILGNMKVPETSMTFKKAGELIGEQESFADKLQNKTTKALDNSKTPIVLNKLISTNTATVLEDASKQRFNETQKQKDALINIQNNMLETADRLGIKPEKISEKLEAKMGKLMKKGYKCEDGALIPIAKDGKKIKTLYDVIGDNTRKTEDELGFNDYNLYGRPSYENPLFNTSNDNFTDRSGIQKYDIDKLPITGASEQDPYLNLTPYAGSNYQLTPLSVENKMMKASPEAFNPQMRTIPNFEPAYNEDSFKTSKPKPYSLADKNRVRISSIIPEIALLADRPDQVQGQQFTPELFSPYQVSFQDRRNQAQSTMNALQRGLVNNPAAISSLAAQKYNQENTINAEEFRTNQAIQSDILNKNVGLLNQAEMANIQLADTQMDRQAKAKAITKDRKYQALASIANKYDQKRAENNKIRLMEQLSGYRYNPVTKQMEYIGPDASFVPFSGQTTSNQNKVTIHRDAEGNITGTDEVDVSDSQDMIARKKAQKAAMSKFGGIFNK